MRGSGIAGRGEKLGLLGCWAGIDRRKGGAGGREEPRKRKCRGNKIKKERDGRVGARV